MHNLQRLNASQLFQLKVEWKCKLPVNDLSTLHLEEEYNQRELTQYESASFQLLVICNKYHIYHSDISADVAPSANFWNLTNDFTFD